MSEKSRRAETALDVAERICAARGLRLTPLRKRAIAALAEAGKPMKAYDLLAELGEGDAPAKPASAYRALDFLEEIGLVHRVAGINAFMLCAHGGGEHASSLYLCESCGAAEESAIALRVSGAAPEGFQITRSVVEHYGLCRKCASRQAT